jgi:integrase
MARGIIRNKEPEMKKPTAELTTKMLSLIDLTTYQGRITYLAISFLCQTGATVGETARLKVGDVYSHGRPKKWVRLRAQMPQCTMLLRPAAQKTVKLALEVQAHQGLLPHYAAPLFPTPGGKAFTEEQMGSLFWMYQEAAEGCPFRPRRSGET